MSLAQAEGKMAGKLPAPLTAAPRPGSTTAAASAAAATALSPALVDAEMARGSQEDAEGAEAGQKQGRQLDSRTALLTAGDGEDGYAANDQRGDADVGNGGTQTGPRRGRAISLRDLAPGASPQPSPRGPATKARTGHPCVTACTAPGVYYSRSCKCGAHATQPPEL